jgi:hypothetical protein
MSEPTANRAEARRLIEALRLFTTARRSEFEQAFVLAPMHAALLVELFDGQASSVLAKVRKIDEELQAAITLLPSSPGIADAWVPPDAGDGEPWHAVAECVDGVRQAHAAIARLLEELSAEVRHD